MRKNVFTLASLKNTAQSSIIKSKVVWTSKVEKQLERIPAHIAKKFRSWARTVEEDDIQDVRKFPGLHDSAAPTAQFILNARMAKLN